MTCTRSPCQDSNIVRSAMIDATIDGKYRLTRKLGAGAMGAVYEAEHMATGRRVRSSLLLWERS